MHRDLMAQRQRQPVIDRQADFAGQGIGFRSGNRCLPVPAAKPAAHTGERTPHLHALLVTTIVQLDESSCPKEDVDTERVVIVGRGRSADPAVTPETRVGN